MTGPPARPDVPRGRWRRGWRWLLLLAGVVPLGMSLDYHLYMRRAVHPAGGEPAVVFLARGMPYRAVLDELQRADLVRRPLWFTLHGVLHDRLTRARAGTHEVPAGTSPVVLWGLLTTGGRDDRLRVTIQVGWTAWRVSDALGRRGIAPADELLVASRDLDRLARDPRLRALLPMEALRALLKDEPHVVPLEGLLYPDTYHLSPGQSTPRVLSRFMARFFHVWEPVVKAARGRKGRIALTPYQRLILASIIERECLVDDERALVASVFVNRLERGMRLQTDPSIVYHPLDYREVPAPRHRKERANPHNTYAHDGLPPTPIGNPGRASIAAAFAPATSDYLYFVARRDGSNRHAFSRTHAEHRAKIKKHLR
jgi:UPF0755 protein